MLWRVDSTCGGARGVRGDGGGADARRPNSSDFGDFGECCGDGGVSQYVGVSGESGESGMLTSSMLDSVLDSRALVRLRGLRTMREPWCVCG